MAAVGATRVFHMCVTLGHLDVSTTSKWKIEKTHICAVEGYVREIERVYSTVYSLHEYVPITSAFCVEATNHASSPNFPNLYLERNMSFGNPHATDTKCGLIFLFGSTTVENPLRNARENRRVVQQIDCIFDVFVVYIFWVRLFFHFRTQNVYFIHLICAIQLVLEHPKRKTLQHLVLSAQFFISFFRFCCWHALMGSSMYDFW